VDTHPVPQRAVLLLMRADGSRKRIIRRTGARFEYDATFSPDGGSILFIRGERIYLMRRDGRSAHPCTAMSSSRRARASPATGGRSPWRGRAGKSGAYFVMNADGTPPSAHQRGQRFDWGCPSWFPDGKRLVFAKDYKLHVASVDGTNIERITDDKDGTLYAPPSRPMVGRSPATASPIGTGTGSS